VNLALELLDALKVIVTMGVTVSAVFTVGSIINAAIRKAS
jgi:hypothetical protein